MKKIYSLIAMIMAVLLTFSSVGHVFAAEERELTNDEKAAFIVRDEWTGWVKDFTASLSELDKNATAKIYEDMDFYDMQYRFTEKYKKVPEYLDEEGKPTQKLKDMIKEKRKEINMRKSGSSTSGSTEMIDWTGVDPRDWMAKLPDNRYLNDINLPGMSNCDMSYGNLPALTDFQKCALGRQDPTKDFTSGTYLNNGFRAFDVGLRYYGSSPNAFVTNFGNNKSGSSTSYTLDGATSLASLLDTFRIFLNNHPTETIVLVMRNENVNATEYTNLVNKINSVITQDSIKNYIYSGSTFPKLKDVRKKIVLVSRFDEKTTFNKGIYFGYNIQGMSGQVVDNVSIFGENHEYHYKASERAEYVTSALETVTAKSIGESGKKGKNGAIIYTGGYYYDSAKTDETVLPDAVATEVNKAIKGFDFVQGKLVGMLMMEFVDSDLAPLIYKTNP